MSDRPIPTQEQLQAYEDAVKRKNDATNQLLEAVEKEGSIFGRILKPVALFFSTMFQNVWEGFANIAKGVLDNFTDGSLKRLWETTPEEWEARWRGWKDRGWLDENDVQALNALFPSEWIGKGLVKGFLSLKVTTAMIEAVTTVVGSSAMQRMNRAFSPSVPTPEAIARVSFLYPEHHARVVDAMKRSGLSKEDIELIFGAQHQTYGPGETMALYNRGILDNAAADDRLSEMGFTKDRRQELRKLWTVIPSVQDMIRFMAKEAYEPQMISHFGLGANTPAELYTELAKHGMSEDDASRFWYSHWEHPGLQTVLEMYHRGIIPWKTVDLYFGVVEIPPFWRDKIRQVAHNVLTRVDVRRIHDMGIIDDERLIKAYQDQGYDRDNAEIMAEFTKEYNARDKRDLTQADILKGYEDRDIDYNTAVYLLVRIGYKEDSAAYLVTRVDLEMERAVRLEAIEATKRKFTSFLISEAQARNELSRVNLRQARINELIGRWKVLLISDTKHPSKTDLDKLLRAEVINEGEYTAQMSYIGYSEKYIGWYKELIAKGMEA